MINPLLLIPRLQTSSASSTTSAATATANTNSTLPPVEMDSMLMNSWIMLEDATHKHDSVNQDFEERRQ